MVCGVFPFYKWFVTWLKILLCHLLNILYCPCSPCFFPLTPELLKISSPDSFYECSSTLGLVLKWVLLAPWLLCVWEGGIRRTQQLFHPLKILWSRWTCRDWAEPREGGNQDVWPNKNQFIDFCSGYSHLMSVQAKPSFSDVPVSLFFNFYSCSNWI